MTPPHPPPKDSPSRQRMTTSSTIATSHTASPSTSRFSQPPSPLPPMSPSSPSTHGISHQRSTSEFTPSSRMSETMLRSVSENVNIDPSSNTSTPEGSAVERGKARMWSVFAKVKVAGRAAKSGGGGPSRMTSGSGSASEDFSSSTSPAYLSPNPSPYLSNLHTPLTAPPSAYNPYSHSNSNLNSSSPVQGGGHGYKQSWEYVDPRMIGSTRLQQALDKDVPANRGHDQAKGNVEWSQTLFDS